MYDCLLRFNIYYGKKLDHLHPLDFFQETPELYINFIIEILPICMRLNYFFLIRNGINFLKILSSIQG